MMMKMTMMTSYHYNDNNVEVIIIMCRSIQGFSISLHPLFHPACEK